MTREEALETLELTDPTSPAEIERAYETLGTDNRIRLDNAPTVLRERFDERRRRLEQAYALLRREPEPPREPDPDADLPGSEPVAVPESSPADALCGAARRGAVEDIRARLEAGARVDERDGDGSTALHHALSSDAPAAFLPRPATPGMFVTPDYTGYRRALDDLAATAAALLEAGADPNAADGAGRVPLWIALDRIAGASMAPSDALIGTVRALLAHGADPDARNDEGRTPLMRAALDSGLSGALDALADAGADLEARDAAGRTALELALEADEPHVAERLMGRGARVSPGALERHAQLLLYTAALRGDADAVRRALAAGADPNTPATPHRTPLSAAVESCDEVSVRALLDAGADPCPHEPDERTLLHAAAERGHAGVVRALLKAGADPSSTFGRAGCSVLETAARTGAAEVVRVLAAAGADLEATTRELGCQGCTPLHRAAEADHASAVRALLEAGARVDARDARGSPPPHRAAAAGATGSAAALLEAGADPGLRDHGERTALDRARRESHPELVRLLERAESGNRNLLASIANLWRTRPGH